MVLPASHKVSRVSWYSGSCPVCSNFRVRGSHPLRQAFPDLSTSSHISFDMSSTPKSVDSGLGSFPFARRYSENRSFFLFLRVLRCFTSPGFLTHTYVFSMVYLLFTVGGFPHSDIHGSMLTCSSPWLFAAYRVLLRLLIPRHPPYALNNLIILKISFGLLFSVFFLSLFYFQCSFRKFLSWWA